LLARFHEWIIKEIDMNANSAQLDLPTESLAQRWQTLREQQPGLRIRNAAQLLNVSEMELLLAQPEGQVVRLRPQAGDIMQRLERVGRVMTLARNEEVVHETKGTIKDFKVAGKSNIGLCVGEIDLRTFFNHWQHAFAVCEKGKDGQERHSLQFFSGAGEAIQKVYQVDETDRAAWQALVADFISEEQRPVLNLVPRRPTERSQKLPHGLEAFREDWAQLKDVHHFHALTQKHGVDRLSALELIGRDWAYPVPDDSLEVLLQRAAQCQDPIMVFVGNPGTVQIFTGQVVRLMRTGPWFNVLDANFNLHANTEAITSTWVVRRPSTDGDITSLECFNQGGELVVTLFGERKPGSPELDSWRERVRELQPV